VTKLAVGFETIIVSEEIDSVFAAMFDVIAQNQCDRLAAWEPGHHDTIRDRECLEEMRAGCACVPIDPAGISIIDTGTGRVGAAISALI
jgi:hypothetical protein